MTSTDHAGDHKVSTGDHKVSTGDHKGDRSVTTGDHLTDRSPVQVTTWSPQKAAEECGIGRSTIMRKLQNGEIPGAEKVGGKWAIPVPGLIAAGLHVGKPKPPEDQVTTGDHRGDHKVSTGDHKGDRSVTTSDRYSELLIELEHLRAQIEIEKTKRETAEKLALAKDQHIADLQGALRMLDRGFSDRPQPTPTEHTPKPAPEVQIQEATKPEPTPTEPPQEPAPDTREADPTPRGFLGRMRRLFR